MRVFNKLLSYPFPALIVAREMDVSDGAGADGREA